MKHHRRYFKYVVKHKWFVIIAGRKIGAPFLALILHDVSKFSKSEWKPYVDYLFRYKGQNLPDIDLAFKRAVNPHYNNNPHHWQFWQFDVAPQPVWFLQEMVADWFAAGKAMHGSWDIKDWYDRNKDKMVLHPFARNYIEAIIETAPLPNRCAEGRG